MKKELYIFGTKYNAEMAMFYFKRDCPEYKIMGFVEDNPEEEMVYGLEVLSTSSFLSSNKPKSSEIFAPLTSSSGRKDVFKKLKASGCKFASYISPHSIVWDKNAIGENCFIQEGNNIQFGTYIGDNCVFWAGNHIGHHGRIHSHNTFTSHVVLSGRCNIEELCYFGVNSTIRDGLNICPSVFIGMGSIVNKDITEEGIYFGVPAKRLKSSKGAI